MANRRVNRTSLREMSLLDKLEVSSRKTSKYLLGEDSSNAAEDVDLTRPKKGKDLFRAFFFN